MCSWGTLVAVPGNHGPREDAAASLPKQVERKLAGLTPDHLRPVLTSFLQEMRSSGCPPTVPVAERDRYLNVQPPSGYRPGRICAVDLRTGRLQLQARSFDCARKLGVAARFDPLSSRSMAAISLRSQSDVDVARDIARTVMDTQLFLYPGDRHLFTDLPGGRCALIDEVRLGRNEKVLVGYDRPAWRDRMGFGGALWSAGDFSAVWDAVSLAPASGPGALCYFLGGDQVDRAREATMAELAERFSASARRVLSGLPTHNGIHRRTRWCEDPLTQGAYVNYGPGQLSRFASLMSVEEEGEARASGAGPVQFAGDWLSDAFPGYMTGAVQTGRWAADAALAPERAAAA